MENSKGNIVSRLSYSFGAFGNDLLFGLLSTYFIMFVTTHLFNSGNKAQDAKMIGFITLIIFFLRFVELAIDPFIEMPLTTPIRVGEIQALGCSGWCLRTSGFSHIIHRFWRTDEKQSDAISYLVCYFIYYDGYSIQFQRYCILVYDSCIVI